MNIIWLFPPSEGYPNISQYRFFKRMPIRASIIYPYLAASGVTLLTESGNDCLLLDCPTKKYKWSDISKFIVDADFIVLEGRTPIIDETWKAINIVKGINSSVKIIVYGDHVSWFPSEALLHGASFVVVGGDYDVKISKLINDIIFKKTLDHQIINFGLESNLDSISFVDRELTDFRPYYEAWKTKDVFLWNMSSRGCYFDCSFCAWVKTFWNNKIRYRSPSNMAKETLMLFEKYGSYEYVDDSDLYDFDWGLHYGRLLNKMGISQRDVSFCVQSHPALVPNISELKEMKLNGLHLVKLGVESCNDSSLQKMNKCSSLKLIERAVKNLKEADISIHANLMVGFPWENKQDVLDSLDFIKKLDPNQAQFSLLIPYPGTKIWCEAKEQFWFIQDPNIYNNYDAAFPMLKMDGLSGKEIVDLYRQCWSSFYFNPKYVLKHILAIRHFSGLKQLASGFKSIYFGHMKAVDEKKYD